MVEYVYSYGHITQLKSTSVSGLQMKQMIPFWKTCSLKGLPQKRTRPHGEAHWGSQSEMMILDPLWAGPELPQCWLLCWMELGVCISTTSSQTPASYCLVPQLTWPWHVLTASWPQWQPISGRVSPNAPPSLRFLPHALLSVSALKTARSGIKIHIEFQVVLECWVFLIN